jgi:hypothetical protein
MASLSATRSPVTDLLCADPLYGTVYTTLLSGGSWYEADQQYWQIRYELMAEELGALLLLKPSKAVQEKAQTLLGDLRAAAASLACSPEINLSVSQIEQIMAQWVPKSKSKSVKRPRNAFDALDDSEEE